MDRNWRISLIAATAVACAVQSAQAQQGASRGFFAEEAARLGGLGKNVLDALDRKDCPAAGAAIEAYKTYVSELATKTNYFGGADYSSVKEVTQRFERRYRRICTEPTTPDPNAARSAGVSGQPSAAPPAVIAGAGFLQQQNDVKPSRAGAYFSGGAERIIVLGPDRVTTNGGQLDLFFPQPTGPAGDFRTQKRFANGVQVIGNFTQGDASSAGQILPGMNTGFQFIQNFNGLDGVVGVPGGQSARVDVDMQRFQVLALGWVAMVPSGPTSIRVGVGPQVSHRSVDTAINQQNLTMPGISSAIASETRDLFAGVRLAGEVGHQFAGMNFFVGGMGYVAAGYLNSTGSVSQQFNCSPCGPPFNSVYLSRNFSSSGASVSAGLGGVVGFVIANRAEIFASGGVEIEPQSHIDTPAINTDPRASMSNQSRLSSYFRITTKWGF